MTDYFHKAAQDGNLEALREASRRDTNLKDEDGMTPTLWAAFQGNLEALRLLTGRGGEPEKCDNYGNTALHLASAKGHLNCVSFLVNFGVNIWELDIDLHTAKDLAAINSRDDILKFLDNAASVQEGQNPKQVKHQQEKAKKDAEKRIKNFQKIQKKAEKLASKDEEKLEKDRRKMSLIPMSDSAPSTEGRRSSISVALLNSGRRDSTLLGEAKSGSRFSDMVGGGTVNSHKVMGGVLKKLAGKQTPGANDQFTIRDVSGDGKQTLRSISGLRRDSEILFSRKEEPNVDNLDLLDTDDSTPRYISEPASIFSRPGFGNVTFRNSITAFNHMTINEQGEDRGEDSLGSAGSFANRNDRVDRMGEVWEEDSDLSDDDDLDQGKEFTSLRMFLAATGLSDWIPTFLKEKIDLDALMLLTEDDLAKSLNMPLGPRKKLLKAVNERRSAIEEPDVISDSRL